MKKIIKIYTIFFLSIILFNSCDGHGFTTINVINKSSYDLQIKLELKAWAISEPQFNGPNPEILELSKNQSGSFNMDMFGPSSPPTPEETIEKIIFSNLDTGIVIKVVDQNIRSVFNLASNSGSKAEYILEITDDLLQ